MLETTVSHYRILSRLGDGGMGVVYEAEDLNLGRRAALKFLPEKAHSDAGALERFLREAKSASALNHPHICTIYEFGEHEGKPYLAMELLEGQSLDKLLNGRPVPIQRLLEIGIQSADALDAAHRKGIIHRDIKPANIFLLANGQVKLLDFGLAKFAETAVSDATSDSAGSGSGHDASTLTNAGAAVGTIAYMSPEQARGEPLDIRTDLFSLGVVLYQLASGQHPFPGATTAVIFDAILNRTPAPLLERNASLPPALDSILSKALEKDRDYRYQSAADLRADLKRLQRGSASDQAAAAARISSGNAATYSPASSSDASLVSGSGVSGSGVNGSGVGAYAVGSAAASSAGSQQTAVAAGSSADFAAVAPRKKVLPGIYIAVGVVVLTAIAGVLVYLKSGSQPFSSISLQQLTDSGNIENLAISPDGKTLAEAKNEKGQRSLWIRNIPTNTDTQILPPFGSTFVGLSFSPDGNSLYFSRATEQSSFIRTIYQISVLGGTPRPLVRDADSAPSFSPDGERFVYLRQTPELKDHFAEMHVANKDMSGDHIIAQSIYNSSAPIWLPDGKHIAWGELEGPNRGAYVIFDGDSQKSRRLEESKDKLYGRESTALPGFKVLSTVYLPESDRFQIGLIDLAQERYRIVTNDLNSYAWPSASADGHLLAVISLQYQSTLSYYKSGSAIADSTINLKTSPLRIAWAPDGHLVFGGGTGFRFFDRSSQNTTLLDTANMQTTSAVSACPDGHLILVGIPKGSNHTVLFRANADGSGLTPLTTEGIVRNPKCVDGNVVNYTVFENNRSDAWTVPEDGGTPKKLFSTNSTASIAFSRDGKWALSGFSANDTHEERILAELHDLAHPGTPNKLIVIDPRDALSGAQPKFSPDGASLVYPINEKGLSSLLSQPLDGGASRVITETSPVEIRDFTWSPDGSQLAVLRENTDSNVVLITDETGKSSK